MCVGGWWLLPLETSYLYFCLPEGHCVESHFPFLRAGSFEVVRQKAACPVLHVISYRCGPAVLAMGKLCDPVGCAHPRQTDFGYPVC